MRLELRLPTVAPDEMSEPTECPYPKCGGRHFRQHQLVAKPLRDTVYDGVTARRYQCRRCGRTFRVYPTGVNRASTSQRVKGLAVMLYLLGLSYGAVALALEALGVYLCKSQDYEAVQAAARQVPGMKRRQVFAGVQTPALGADLTSVKCRGKWLQLGLSVDPLSGLVLSLDRLPNAEAATLQTWLAPIAAAVGAALLVSDDADAFKTAADQLGLDQQVCKAHVVRNTDALVESLTPAVGRDADGSLAALGVSPAQASADVKRLGELVHSRQTEQAAELAELAARYAPARSPRSGQPFSLAYRLRLLFLDRWNLWGRLTRYRTWRGPKAETLDGTNNACERGIGWWIMVIPGSRTGKERYRSMRGYKRAQSAVNVSRLLAWCGNHLGRGGADLARLMA
jgi:transposase-like protein